jgi:DNA sulfur modification protein DndD
MHNFGIYAGTNTFEFNSYKPIALIGGMNGRGKTTFLEAILLALYGPNSFAYSESNYKSYNQYLRSYVNRNDASQTCYVELEFEIDNEVKEKYHVRREWDSVSKRTNEVITIKKDDHESEFLSNNWAMFVENILPSALSSFFFFDGEKIANLAVDETNDQLKESIRSMLGISVLDVLNNDLARNLKKIGRENKTSEAAERVQKLREAKDFALQDLNKMDQEKLKIEDKIAKDNDQLVTLHQKYIARGGDAAEQRQKTLDQRAKVNAEYASNEEQLMVLASGELPLALVKDLIMEIKLQAEDEHDEAILKQSLSQISVLFDEFKSTYTENADAGSKFVEYISRNVEDNVTEPLYQLSNYALFQANSLAESKIEESLKVARVTISSKRKLKRQLDEFDSYLSVDVNETELTEIYGKIKKAEQTLIEDKVKLSALQQERTLINSRVISSTAEFNQAVEKYLSQAETQDETDRTIKYTNMAMHILDKYMIALQTRKTDVLGQTITVCYKKLANKKNLIDTIVMDPTTLDLKYLSSQGKEVPKNSLSAGEKQLMVIAILWALAICSKKKLPVIIDTPLSRLDSLHRTALIKTYFPNASAQTIILSTDSEIDQNYYQMMAENVGDEFTLDYDELTKSTTLRRGYF